MHQSGGHLDVRTTSADRDAGDEPTADVLFAPPRRGMLERADRRTRVVLAGAALVAVAVNAGAVWAYWHLTGTQTGRADAAAAVVQMSLRGRSDLDRPLTPGRTGNLTVTVTNDNNFPVRITAVRPGPGPAVADDEHRENGCVHPGVQVTQEVTAVDWRVARNHVGAFTVPDGLAMERSSDPACAGAVFTVPVQVTGVAG